MTMQITQEKLHELALTDSSAVTGAIAAPLNSMLINSSINTPLRTWHFLAQICYESGFFRRLTESLNYSHASAIAQAFPHIAARADSLVNNPEALANAAYAAWMDSHGEVHDDLGNGPEGNGNGWKYRGRGLIQITGKWNYTHYAGGLGLDLVDDPDLAAAPDNAVRLAIAFWNSKGCNDGADADDVAWVTRKINGPGMDGLADRKVLRQRAETIFN